MNNAVPPADPWTMPIEQTDVGNPRLYQDDVWEPYFARLRRDDPVYNCRRSAIVKERSPALVAENPSVTMPTRTPFTLGARR